MILLDERNIPGDVIEFELFLQEKGILLAHSSEFATAPAMKSINRGLWIVLDDQYPDVVALIKNRSHVVKNPLTKEQMVSLKKSALAEFYKTTTKFFDLVFTCILITVITGFCIYVALSIT